MGTYYVLNASIVSLVIAAAEDKPFREVLLPPLLPDLLHWATNVALGILVAVAWIRVPEALPLLVVPLALAYFAYRGWVKTLRERDRMHQMARTADAISEQGDLEKRLAGEDGGDEVGSLAATLNRMLDRLEASFRRERRFISEASHELRTPVTICRGHLEVLGADPDPEELRETIDVVLDELNRVGRLIGDLTILARAEDPRFVRPAGVQIGRFLDELATKAVPLLNGRLHATPAPNGAVAQADAQRLTQALINLLHNAAVHTTSDTKVELRVAGEERFWRFEVEDTGGGLPPGREETLFRPFSRATTASPGSGLGLAIVRQIAEAHGGSAGAENRPGEGVTFWIRVPR
jgi:signal transduction histidine kinase